jgi:hypothetical protein
MITHTFVVPHGCIHIGGALFDFVEKCASGIFRHILRGQNLYVWIKNAYRIQLVRFNKGLSSITKKGDIESASRTLVGFSVLNDNLIKGLISFV